MNTKTMRIVSGVLSAVGAAGVIGTSYLAVKEAPKTKEAMNALGENPTFWQKAKTFIKGYKWSIAAGGLTIASNVTSAVMQAKMVASLSASIAGLTAIANNSEKFKQKAKEVIGKENYNKITQAFAKEQSKKIDIPKNVKPNNILVWEEHIGFFLATEAGIRKAMGLLNRRLNKQISETEYSYKLDDFVNDSGAELLDKEEAEPYLLFGWSIDQIWFCTEDNFVDIDEELFNTVQKDANGNEYRELRFEYVPVYDPETFEEVTRDEGKVNAYLNDVPEDYQDNMREILGYEPKYITDKKRKQ